MQLTIGIHPDDYSNAETPPGRKDSSSPRWAALLEKTGHCVKWVDVRRPDILEQLRDCQGFMWRWAHFGGMGRIARRLLPVLEQHLKLVVYPDRNTCWHYDDKIAQTYLLQAAGIPMPQTWVFFERQAAASWAQRATYPLVLKLAAGAGSTNVRLLRDGQEAHYWIDRLFEERVVTLQPERLSAGKRLKQAWQVLFRGRRPQLRDNGMEMQSGYILFQEFLPANDFDTRVVVIGNHAFAQRRFNRPGDFRASGSGRICTQPERIDHSFLRLAFQTARSLDLQCCAVDGLYKNSTPVISEISYTCPVWRVYPGFWLLEGDPMQGALHWQVGNKWREEIQIEDFLARLHSRAAVAAPQAAATN